MRHATYSEFHPRAGRSILGWSARSLRCLRKAYRRRFPAPEVIDYLGMRARLVKQSDRLPPVGSLGVVTTSELSDGARLYHIEFDTVTLIGPLPEPGVVELLGR
ncbi:MAG: hypothetical protein ACRDTE_17930 [Pseudonocardiaceae bacterium]